MMLIHNYNCRLLNIIPPVTDVHVMLKRTECEKRVGRKNVPKEDERHLYLSMK